MTVRPAHTSQGGTADPAFRAPVLFPAPVKRVQDAAQRVFVRPDGALVHRKGPDEKVLLAAGDLQHAALIPDGTRIGDVQLPAGRGDWVLLRGRARSVALSLPGWTPGQPAFPTDPLALSGIRAVLGALGHPDPGAFDLDEPGGEDLLNGPPPLVLDPRPRPSRRPADLPLTALRAILVLLGALFVGEATVSRIVNGDEPSKYPPTVMAGLAVLLSLPLLTVVLGPLLPRRPLRREAGRATVLPDQWAAAGGRPQIRLTDEGAALLVLDPDGTATAVPGPALGGVVKVFILAADGLRPTSTALLTAKSEVLVTLPATWWASDEDAVHVQALLRNAGLRTSKQRVPRAAVQPPIPRRQPSSDVDEVAFMTICLAGLLCFSSALSGATVGALVSAATCAIALGVSVREWRRRR